MASENAKKDRVVPIFLIIVLVYFLVSVFIYYNDYVKIWIEEDYTDEYAFMFTAFEYWGPAIWGIITIVIFIMLVKVFGKDTDPGKVWLLFSFGLICWNIADWLYTYLYVTTQEYAFPDPSPARIIYFIGYMFIIVGMIKQMRITPIKLAKSTIVTWSIIILAICLVILIAITIPSLQDSVDENVTQYALVELVLFAIADLVVIFLAIMLIILFKGGEFAKAWFVIALGFAIVGSYDMLIHAIENVYPDTYYYVTDFLYYAFYWILATGALLLRKSLK